MKRIRARRVKLGSLLLGSALLALLAWRYLPPRRPAAPGKSIDRHGGLTPSLSAARPAPEPETPAGTAFRSAPQLTLPIAGLDPGALRDDYSDRRGGSRLHEALDILAPRGTPVLAVDDGVVRKLFTSVPGGLTVYQFDGGERYCYYYAHLDGYAPALREGQRLRRGDLVGYVGTTGNAPKDTPHLHFAVSLLGPDRKWWTGKPIDPYPLLVGAP